MKLPLCVAAIVGSLTLYTLTCRMKYTHLLVAGLGICESLEEMKK